MNRPITKIGLILLLIVLLPATFFSVYEINSLSNSEEALEKIYLHQLDAILFSVNQHANDVVSSWASRVNLMLIEESWTYDEAIQRLLQENPAIQSLYLIDSLEVNQVEAFSSDTLPHSPSDHIQPVVQQHKKIIARLFPYLKGGYRKIETLEMSSEDSLQTLLFALDLNRKGYRLCSFEIDPEKFILENLSPKLQAVAQDEFLLDAYDQHRPDPIYQTESQQQPTPLIRKDLWIFPHHQLGIALKGTTIDQLVRSRFQTNIFLILLLGGVLLFGVWLAFRNIKREVDLAQAKQDFVSNVSHEIRTPLSLISMFAETLQLGRVKDEARRQEYYEIISKESRRLGGIVNKILNFSQIEANKVHYQMATVQLNEVVYTVWQNYDFHLRQQGFTCQLDLAEDLPPIYADQEAIAEAIVNLLDNAMKYSMTDKHIKVSTGKETDQVYVSVADHGVGIPPEHHETIFHKFYRVDMDQAPPTRGTGLGLTLVRYVMTAHRGHVRLQSQLGVGSTFSLVFPVDPSYTPPHSSPSVSSGSPNYVPNSDH